MNGNNSTKSSEPVKGVSLVRGGCVHAIISRKSTIDGAYNLVMGPLEILAS